MASISVYQARAELSQLIERALSGEEIVITRRGRPTVRLLPVEQAMPQRKPGALKGLFEVSDSFFEPLPEDILEAFYNSSVEPQEEAAPAPDGPERR
jgi:prevent-host-death family protein